MESLTADGFVCRVVDCHDRTTDQVRWILDQVTENPPDVFVPNLVVSAYHASRWIRQAGIPTVGILHSDDAYYRAIQDEFVFGRKEHRLDALTCVSRSLENEVQGRNPQSTEVWRIPYGVPIPPKRVRSESGRLRIAYVGRLAEEQKRISDVTRSLILACRTIPGTEAVIFGDGPDKGNVEEILATEGQDTNVSLGGNVPNHQIQRVLMGFDVITLLSDYEGLPISLLEAMACGCVPVCLHMNSGISELLQSPPAGLIVNDRDRSFVEAIRKLRDDQEFRDELSSNARNRIASEYSQESTSDAWAEYLNRISKTKRDGSVLTPRKIRLPNRNPHLESVDQRRPKPSHWVQIYRRGRMRLGKIRRQAMDLVMGTNHASPAASSSDHQPSPPSPKDGGESAN